MDKARTRTDRKLKQIESEIGRVYKEDPALKRIQGEYARFMEKVQKESQKEYDAYVKESDRVKKVELKKAYSRKVEELTVKSGQFKDIMRRFSKVMAWTNQKALDVINDQMISVFAENFNSISEECEKVGIKVGKARHYVSAD